MNLLPDWLQAARDHWQWRGHARPDFAVTPGPDQESVWDYPRPPRIVADVREVVIRWGELEVARTHSALRVLETGHPPSFYLPWTDVDRRLLQPASGSSFCEWKGPASYWSLAANGRSLPKVGWSYPRPMQGAEPLAQCVAFYPSVLDCTVGGFAVQPQPGGFYGGWITPELTGPFKGDPGSEGW
ncbi:DUF427 domain-containing protein [soil metagenome]